MKSALFVILALLAMLNSAFASSKIESKIRDNLRPVLINEDIRKVQRVGKTGIYEVVTEGNIYYTDKRGSVVFVQSVLIDAKTRENLTEKSNNALGEFDFKSLPFDRAITVIRGDGSRRLVTFEDPNCGYCKRLMSEFLKLKNVTIYTFIVPILGGDTVSKKDSLSRAKSIMCSTNPSKAWVDYMSNPNFQLENKECDVSFDTNLQLFKKLRLRGTPAILFESNSKIPGIATADQIEAKLNKGGAQ